jgi:hypothetical protein
MRRLAATFVIAGATLAGGCATDAPSSGQPSGQSGPSAGAKPAAKPAAPYFEMNGEDGKTYVFGSADSMMAYMKDKKLPATTTHYNKGKSVEVEDAHAARLIAEYESQHK